MKRKRGANIHIKPTPTISSMLLLSEDKLVTEQTQKLNYIYFLGVISEAQRSLTLVQNSHNLYFLSVFHLDVKRVTFQTKFKYL